MVTNYCEESFNTVDAGCLALMVVKCIFFVKRLFCCGFYGIFVKRFTCSIPNHSRLLQ